MEFVGRTTRADNDHKLLLLRPNDVRRPLPNCKPRRSAIPALAMAPHLEFKPVSGRIPC